MDTRKQFEQIMGIYKTEESKDSCYVVIEDWRDENELIGIGHEIIGVFETFEDAKNEINTICLNHMMIRECGNKLTFNWKSKNEIEIYDENNADWNYYNYTIYEQKMKSKK